MNRCKELGIMHAWSDAKDISEFTMVYFQACLNCGLKRTRCHEEREWWSYSDETPDEPIVNIRPL